jgi:hypothetical protein
VGSVIAALILFSPVIAFLMVIVAEMQIDLLMESGTIADCAIAVGAIGWLLCRKFWPQPEAPQWELEQWAVTIPTARGARPIGSSDGASGGRVRSFLIDDLASLVGGFNSVDVRSRSDLAYRLRLRRGGGPSGSQSGTGEA